MCFPALLKARISHMEGKEIWKRSKCKSLSKETSVTAINGLYLLRFISRIRHLSFLLGNVAQGAWQQVIDKWYGNFLKSTLNRERSNTSEDITFFSKKTHLNDPYHLNLSRSNRFFHANGKRSRLRQMAFFRVRKVGKSRPWSYVEKVDSMLPCVCSVIDRRRRQNVVRT